MSCQVVVRRCRASKILESRRARGVGMSREVGWSGDASGAIALTTTLIFGLIMTKIQGARETTIVRIQWGRWRIPAGRALRIDTNIFSQSVGCQFADEWPHMEYEEICMELGRRRWWLDEQSALLHHGRHQDDDERECTRQSALEIVENDEFVAQILVCVS